MFKIAKQVMVCCATCANKWDGPYIGFDADVKVTHDDKVYIYEEVKRQGWLIIDRLNESMAFCPACHRVLKHHFENK